MVLINNLNAIMKHVEDIQLYSLQGFKSSSVYTSRRHWHSHRHHDKVHITVTVV